MQEASGKLDITRLLQEWQGGNAEALERLVPLVYNELHTLASRYLRRERRGHALQTTDLVNEAYLKLAGQRRVDWKNRAHFFGVAAQLMRRILVDHARRGGSAKRGGRALHVTLDDELAGAAASAQGAVDVFALDRALSRLEARDARQGRVVELRFFGGLTFEEAAEVMSLAPITVKREWAVAKAWLYRELTGDVSSGAGEAE
jgi:RNA polymerase sigma-70 factor (ECF subfamily)